ncbi:MAG: hypothetical protein KDK66_07205 [Deltaproteobacteria bacterium]|nr:hypothetical protein [Deltaproteobacteria bacterium]
MKYLVILSVLIAFSFNLSAEARFAPPSPPQKNPHEAQTPEDKARVAFALKAVGLILEKNLNLEQSQEKSVSSLFLNKDLNCLKTLLCWQKDGAFVEEVSGIQIAKGRVVEIKHPHIIPWSFENFKANQDPNQRMIEKPSSETNPVEDKTALKEEAKPMEIPQLLADEYMIHLYVRFSKQSNWYHLNVIVTEDKEGKLSLRHFFVTPMRNSMPPGAVC